MKQLLCIAFLFQSIFLISLDDRDHIIEDQLKTSLLYAPWRKAYAKKYQQQSEMKGQSSNACPFCLELSAGDDEKYFILKRGAYCAVTLNIFPYANGHLLIIPYEHKPHLNDFSPEERAEMMELANSSVEILQKAYAFSGANVGFNIGKCAGASIPDHLHMQVIPRTSGTQAFIHLIGKTPVISIELREVYNTLKPLF